MKPFNSGEITKTVNAESASPWVDEKESLRSTVRRRLAALEPEPAAQAASQAADRLLQQSFMQKASTVLMCLSFGVEIDTWKLADRLVTRGVRVFVPRAVYKTRRLHWHRYPCAMRTLSFGLRQPRSGEPELPARAIDGEVDVALLLGLGFDQRGYRLGYGAGFFDRFLVGRRFPAWGVAFDRQILDRVPNADHDIPMAGVVTPSRVMESLGDDV